MFRKLIKWELKSQKQFLYLCIAAVVIGIVSSVVNTILEHMGDNTGISLAVLLCKMFVTCTAFSLLVTWVITTCTRFRKNLFKDEGYLMHTLPVSAEQLILSKILAPLACLFACLAAIYLEISIYLKDMTVLWDMMYESFIKEFSGLGGIGIATILLILLQAIMLLCGLYMSITTGYRFSKNKDIATALIFILLYTLYEFLGIVCMVCLFMPQSHSINKAVESAGDTQANILGLFISVMCIIDALAIALCTGFSIRNIKKHLNLE